MMSIACLQVKQQELQVDLGKCESRNSELEQAILNKDARIKELEDELRRLNKQLDERGSSSGLFLEFLCTAQAKAQIVPDVPQCAV